MSSDNTYEALLSSIGNGGPAASSSSSNNFVVSTAAIPIMDADNDGGPRLQDADAGDATIEFEKPAQRMHAHMLNSAAAKDKCHVCSTEIDVHVSTLEKKERDDFMAFSKAMNATMASKAARANLMLSAHKIADEYNDLFFKPLNKQRLIRSYAGRGDDRELGAVHMHEWTAVDVAAHFRLHVVSVETALDEIFAVEMNMLNSERFHTGKLIDAVTGKSTYGPLQVKRILDISSSLKRTIAMMESTDRSKRAKPSSTNQN